MKLKLLVGSVLCSTALFSAVDAKAASPFTANDLILCFDSNGGTGSTVDLEVDLGNYQTLGDMSGGTLNLNSLLTSAYGSSWATSGNVSWGIIGANSTSQASGGSTVFITDATGDSAASQQISQQHGAAVDVFDVYNAAGLTSVGSSPLVAGTLANTLSDSFTVNYDLNGSSGQGIGDSEGDIVEQNINGANTSMDVYQIVAQDNSGNGGAVNDVGSFSLNTSGQFSAVPEPSTWASILFGAASLVGLRFRRRKA